VNAAQRALERTKHFVQVIVITNVALQDLDQRAFNGSLVIRAA
jgi:hypothetical protein